MPFNNRNQAILENGRKLASFLGITTRTSKLTPLHVDDWKILTMRKRRTWWICEGME